MGTMVEFGANNAKDRGDYVLGEKIVKGGGVLRRMDNPSSRRPLTELLVQQPRQPRPALLVGRREPPVLPAGRRHRHQDDRRGQHSSTTLQLTTRDPIGRTNAAAIWYRALTTYWTSTTDYPPAANGQVKAAE